MFAIIVVLTSGMQYVAEVHINNVKQNHFLNILARQLANEISNVTGTGWQCTTLLTEI